MILVEKDGDYKIPIRNLKQECPDCGKTIRNRYCGFADAGELQFLTTPDCIHCETDGSLDCLMIDKSYFVEPHIDPFELLRKTSLIEPIEGLKYLFEYNNDFAFIEVDKPHNMDYSGVHFVLSGAATI